MTGDAQKFSHISVASDDEDDVVIEAGAPRSRSYGEGESTSQPARDEAAGSAAATDAPARAAATEAAEADGGEGSSEPPSRASTPAPERAAKADKPATASASARKGYEETTLEDLESTKMSGMQKGIIAVALIGIAAFIVYYVAFMG